MSKKELQERNHELEEEVTYWKDKYCHLVEQIIEEKTRKGETMIVDNASVAG
jgi:tryptophan 2,3-dioxygenase